MANFDAAADSPRGYGEFRHGWKIVLASMLGIGLGLSPMPFYTIGVLAPELKQAFGWTMGDIMGAITMTTLVTVIAGPTVGMLAGRIGVRRVALTSVLLFGLVFCALSLQTGSLPLFYAMFGLLALVGAGTLPITWTRTVNAWFDERKGLALGLSLMGTGLFGIFAKPYTSWLVHEFGWRGAYVGLGLLPLLGAQASALGPQLAAVMDAFPVACLRIRAGAEEGLGEVHPVQHVDQDAPARLRGIVPPAGPIARRAR